MGANAEVSVARRVVGDLLRIHRVRLDLTQKEAGERLHVSESCLGSYERAERIPPTEFLRHADEGLDARGAFLACVEMMEGEKYPPKFLGWVQVMPTRRHTHAGLNGPMQLMVTEEGQSLVYVDAQGSVTLISEPLQVTDLFDLFGILRAQALNPWESADLIERKAAQL
ncbi:Scr1 family TA system antitoxin-like transcriptional regulator [Streptomyces sp. NPDC047082]|uniref:Scr1 family TA system antitoxin-like transcriptional regulator n=1 Tax=Streptomyces sp. NPDC047082 TaxID=3155259 RepID=UPI0033C7EA5F